MLKILDALCCPFRLQENKNCLNQSKRSLNNLQNFIKAVKESVYRYSRRSDQTEIVQTFAKLNLLRNNITLVILY